MNSSDIVADASSLSAANKVDAEVAVALREGVNFKVEAGAGAGKTYSLAKATEWLQENWHTKPAWCGKKAVCITFTDRAATELSKRLNECSFIEASTIHHFVWQTMERFQCALIDAVIDLKLLPDGVDMSDMNAVQYTQGIRHVKDGVYFLGHNDVLTLFVDMLDKAGFRKLMVRRYGIILIDEYQDTNRDVMSALIKHFAMQKGTIQLGLFGDAWQTIYDATACGKVDDVCFKVIEKGVNFRSCVEIVNVLNKLRPCLPQSVAYQQSHGTVTVVTCNDFPALERRSDGHFRGDLPTDELCKRVDNVSKVCEQKWNDSESSKILMLTHRALASKQGYSKLLNIITKEHLKEGEDPLLDFFKDVVRPLAEAVDKADVCAIREILHNRRQMVVTKADKRKWSTLKGKLCTGTIFDLLKTIKDNDLLPFPSEVEEIYNKMAENSHEKYIDTKECKGTFQDMRNISYLEMEAAIEFIRPDAVYSTQHGVKGEEYDTVIFVVGRGWNNYKFDEWMPKDDRSLSQEEKKSYERNRNLFYVCLSRARKHLVLLVTVETKPQFMQWLKDMFGENNVVEYCNFVSC